MVTDEEFDKLMAHVENLTNDVMWLRKREILTHSGFMVLKELAISRLATDESLSLEEAEKLFHDPAFIDSRAGCKELRKQIC